MAIERRKLIDKQPNESFPIEINFAKSLPLGATEIDSVTVSATKWQRKIPTVVTSTTEIFDVTDPQIVGVSNTKVRVFLTGGVTNYEYKITVSATFDSGAVLEDEFYVRVKEI